jgi:hypothetical protein
VLEALDSDKRNAIGSLIKKGVGKVPFNMSNQADDVVNIDSVANEEVQHLYVDIARGGGCVPKVSGSSTPWIVGDCKGQGCHLGAQIARRADMSLPRVGGMLNRERDIDLAYCVLQRVAQTHDVLVSFTVPNMLCKLGTVWQQTTHNRVPRACFGKTSKQRHVVEARTYGREMSQRAMPSPRANGRLRYGYYALAFPSRSATWCNET